MRYKRGGQRVSTGSLTVVSNHPAGSSGSSGCPHSLDLMSATESAEARESANNATEIVTPAGYWLSVMVMVMQSSPLILGQQRPRILPRKNPRSGVYDARAGWYAAYLN
jgi:hypothetical protein